MAEVLITLTIIGVIAALTIPNLMQKWNEKVIVSKFKQTYATIDNAVKLAMVQQDWPDSSAFSKISKPDIETIADAFDNNFKYQKKFCKSDGAVADLDWLPDKAYALNGSENHQTTVTKRVRQDSSRVCYYKMNNGATVAISRMNAFSNSNVVNISIDANGKEKPNRVGKDVFPVIVTAESSKTGLFPGHAVHAWASPELFYAGLCHPGWNYSNNLSFQKTCPASVTNPASYIITYDKLPTNQMFVDAGFPAKP